MRSMADGIDPLTKIQPNQTWASFMVSSLDPHKISCPFQRTVLQTPTRWFSGGRGLYEVSLSQRSSTFHLRFLGNHPLRLFTEGLQFRVTMSLGMSKSRPLSV